MTPKKRAEYLFHKYLPYTHNETTEKIKIDTIECALITVNEIIEAMKKVDVRNPFNVYWYEVKNELELM